MTWKIISRPDCIWCDRAKAMLAVNGINFEEEICVTFEERRAFKAQGFSTFPQVFENGTLIGGYSDLKERLT